MDDYCWFIYCPRTNNILGEARTLSEARVERDSWCDDGIEILYMKPESLAPEVGRADVQVLRAKIEAAKAALS